MPQLMNAPRQTLWRRGALLGLALPVAGAIAVVLALSGSHGSANAATVYSDYSVLSGTEPSGITVASSAKEAETITGPVWIQRSNAHNGPEIQTARPVAVGVSGIRVWAAESIRGGICILTYAEGSMGISCGDDVNISRGVVTELATGPGRYLVGLVPNDVSSVTIEHGSGALASSLAVTHNVYAASLSEPASRVVFTSVGAKQMINLGGR